MEESIQPLEMAIAGAPSRPTNLVCDEIGGLKRLCCQIDLLRHPLFQVGGQQLPEEANGGFGGSELQAVLWADLDG